MKKLEIGFTTKATKRSNKAWLDITLGLIGYLSFGLGLVSASKGGGFIIPFIISAIGMLIAESLYVEVRKED